MSKKIFICASDLAVITGHNPYKQKDEIILKYWKKHYKNDYLKCVQDLEKNNIPLKLQENHFECINRISKEHNLNIQSDISKCLNTKNIDDLNKNRENLLKKSLDKIPEKQKAKFQESIDRMAFTNFGIKYENNGMEIYKKKTKNHVIIDRTYYKSDLFHIEYEDEIDEWFIGGKVDGIAYNSKNEKIIVEIKNRVKGLFNSLRDYEKVQCYAYMYVLDIHKIHLAETLKSNKSNAMNIIEIDFDLKFWEKSIEKKIEEFVDDFYNFLENEDRKYRLLSII